MHAIQRKPSIAPPPRIASLAVLPVFIKLQGRRAVVVGGSAAAAWKAELLAAAGAHVAIYAETLASEMAELLTRPPLNGRVVHSGNTLLPPSLLGVSIAVFDAQDDAEAGLFAEAAIEAGVPYNVIDRPSWCSFQFGSIVNRSPLVVGISTDGAAPILGQAVRRRIETVLPSSLSAWAAIAVSIRTRIAERLAPGSQRRSFWETFSNLAFNRAAVGNEAEATDEMIRHVAAGKKKGGCVTLVGAGPGDAEYLTIRAVRALQSADIILFDDLVSEQVLELARREAKRMLVGKRGGATSCRQEDINALMIRLAVQGKHVVRLKSGDPMIFGRAGEEIAEIRQAGLPVEVVPGVTAAFALASRLGVSLTHRDLAHSVRFVTGHGRNGDLPEHLDWRGLADAETTLVAYMSGRTSRGLATRLIKEGLSPSTPVVIAEAVSRPNQTIRRTDLSDLATRGARSGGGPVLLGIGRTFQSADLQMPDVERDDGQVFQPEMRRSTYGS